jgi:hypothetical protein
LSACGPAAARGVNATIPGVRRISSAWLDVAGVVLTALAVLLLVGRVYPYYDAVYALVWGDDLAHGRAPDYYAADAPAAHPLVNAVAALVQPLGVGGSIEVFRFSGPLALGALCVGLFRLGETLYGWPVGLVAALLVLTREPSLLAGGRSYIDVATTALIVWATVLEARRPRRGAPVLLLLAIAGLMRPEPWLMSVAYALWVCANRGASERARLVVMAASAPVLWVLTNLIVTGSLSGPSHGIRLTVSETLLAYPNPSSRTGLLAVPDEFTASLGNFLGALPLAVAVAGMGLGIVWLRSRTVLPLAVAALNTAAFVGLGVVGLSLEQRYLFPSAAMLSLFAGVALAGWVTLAPGRVRREWSRAAACSLVALLVSFVISDLDRIDQARSLMTSETHVQRDLDRLVHLPAAEASLRRARLVYAQTPRPIPLLAHWTGKPISAFSTDSAAPVRPSVIVAARTQAAREYITGRGGVPPAMPAPEGSELVTPSWTLHARR